MKLFHMLTESQSSSAIKHCLSLIIEDILKDGIEITAMDDDNVDLFEKMEQALDHIKSIPDEEKKVEYLMADEDIRQALLDFALEMSKGAYYMDPEELVIFTEVLDEEAEQDEVANEVAHEVEVIHTRKNKKKALN